MVYEKGKQYPKKKVFGKSSKTTATNVKGETVDMLIKPMSDDGYIDCLHPLCAVSIQDLGNHGSEHLPVFSSPQCILKIY